jgi:hypothetical protein
MSDQTPSEEDVAKTLAEYETIAIATGARAEFHAPEFTADGSSWTQVWLKEEPPTAGRCRVTRDGATSEVVVLWQDVVPVEESWHLLWTHRPMPLFGAYLRRSAIRHAFRDVIGERREPGDRVPELTVEKTTERDWDAELAAADSSEKLTGLWAEMRSARARTGAREVVFESRLAELEASEADVWGARGTATVERTRPRDYLPPSSPKKRNRKGRRR